VESDESKGNFVGIRFHRKLGKPEPLQLNSEKQKNRKQKK
jgi:hypothetical protein